MSAGFYALANAELSDEQFATILWALPCAFFAAVIGQTMMGWWLSLLLGAAGAAVSGFHETLLVDRTLWLIALIAGASVSPLLAREQASPEAWRRLIRQLVAMLLALVGAVTVAGGVFLAERSIEALFTLDTREFTAKVIVPGAFGFVGPIVFLALSARAHEAPDDRVSEAMGLIGQTFARLVLVPLLVIYAVVLAAYAARIVVLGDLPSGEVGWIVPLFATTGAATFLALASQPEPGWMSRTLCRIWFPLTIPAVILFVVALGIRVDAYGITPQRYIAILAAVWFTALALGYTIGGARSDVRLIPVTAAVVLLLGAIGPWSLVPVTLRSQTDRLVAALPVGAVPEALSAMDDDERAALCSSVRVLRDLGQLRHAEVALKMGDPGMMALCLAPFGAVDPSINVDYVSADDVLILEGGEMVWGPLRLMPRTGSDEFTATSAPLSLTLIGTTVTVRHGNHREAFDLAAAARVWRADPQSADGDMVLRGQAITLVVRQLHVLLMADAPRLRDATVFVVTDPDRPHSIQTLPQE